MINTNYNNKYNDKYKTSFKLLTCLWLSGLVLLLSGCSSGRNSNRYRYSQDGPPRTYKNLSEVKNAVPKVLPRSKYGNPASYTALGKTYHVRKTALGYNKRGIASWYGTKFNNYRTSSGEPYDMFAMTAAMRTLPIPTFVRVTNLQNGKQIIVKVNDRGPFRNNRIIDLSYAAATKLDMLKKGTALVQVQAINAVAWKKQHLIKQHHSLKKTISKLRHLSQANPLQAKPPKNKPPHPKLFLQVGAYADKTNAENILKRLQKTLLQPSSIKKIKAHGKLVYRVQVGPLSDVKASDLVIKRLHKLGFKKAITTIT